MTGSNPDGSTPASLEFGVRGQDELMSSQSIPARVVYLIACLLVLAGYRAVTTR